MEWRHEGIKVTINEGGLFEVLLEGNERPERFPTLETAKESIEKMRKATRTSLSLPCLTESGTPIVVQTINRNTGELVDTARKGHTSVHPDMPRVRTLLARRTSLNEELQEVVALLNPTRLTIGRRGLQEIMVNETFQDKYFAVLNAQAD